MFTVHHAFFFLITILARTAGAILIPHTQRFTKKLPIAIYLLSSGISYFALFTYIAYFDFALIYVAVSGTCMCIVFSLKMFSSNVHISKKNLLGGGLVIVGGLLSVVL